MGVIVGGVGVGGWVCFVRGWVSGGGGIGME